MRTARFSDIRSQRRALFALAAAVLAGCADDLSGGTDFGDGSSSGGGGGGGSTVDEPDDFGDAYLEYVAAETESGLAVEEYLRATGAPEAFVDTVNAAWALPDDLPVLLGECGEANAFYSPADRQIVMCHELTTHIYGAFAQIVPDDETAAGNATVATWWLVAFHEMGHALIDLHDLPITGREEDAADDLATLVMIWGGLGDQAVAAGLYFALTDTGEYPASTMANEHGLGLQRFYNIACTVYGSDPASYSSIEAAFPEMASRLPRCESEYAQKAESWSTLLADVWL